MRFEIKLDNQTIGFSELEGGDAAMGVAFGRFVPTAAYSLIQADCIKRGGQGIQVPGLTVQLVGDVAIQCSGGIQLIDVSPEVGEAGLQIHLNGVTDPPYSQIFPERVEAYRRRFR